MYTVVGNCPHCGAPVYAPSVWQGITPPPSTPSCNCNSTDVVDGNRTGTAYPNWTHHSSPSTTAGN